MKILLVEDENHKRDELVKCIDEIFHLTPEVENSVSSAVAKVLEHNYDLIILDMALPTFGENSEDRKKGDDQAQGGIEVLRALNLKKRKAKIMIVTQHPDFYIGSKKIKLKDSPKIIRDKYSLEVIGAVLYQYKSNITLQRVKSILRAHQ